MHQVIALLGPRAGIAPISELSRMSAQAITQSALLLAHVSIWRRLMHGERLQRDKGAYLRYLSRSDDGSLELASQIW